MKVTTLCSKFALVSIASVIFYGGSAVAQPAADEAQEAAAPEGVIVVTATRRATDVQEVALAVTALSGTDLADLGISEPFALASQVPNMFVDSANGARIAPRFNLRGLGTNDFSPGTVPSTGVYFDEVFIASTYGQGFPIFDVDRVEVLRGPQGTLWGKNTTAGAINFVSAAPSKALEGYGRATYGNFNAMELEGAVSGPLGGDRLAGRVSFQASTRDGLYRNIVTGKKVGGYTDLAGKAQLLFAPHQDFSARIILSARREEETQYFMTDGISADGTNFFGYKDPSRSTVGNDQPSPTTNDSDGATLIVKAGLGSGEFTSISGYFNSVYSGRADIDASPVNLGAANTEMVAKQYTQELQYTSDDDRSLRYILGGYFLHEDLASRNLNYFANVPAFNTARYITQTTTSLAGFANLEADLTERLTLIGGIRYTSENKDGDFVAASFAPGLDPLNPDQAILTPFVDTSVSDKTDRLTWDATAQYRFTDDLQAYARIASGFKSSAFNFAIYAPNDVSTANPERIIDYEAGIKADLLDRRLSVNLAAFYYDYKNYQIAVFTNGVALRYANAERATVKGLEAELVARLSSELKVSLAGGYSDAKFGEFPNASAPAEVNSGIPLNVSGQRFPRSPKGTLSAQLEYGVRVGAGRLEFLTDWNYVGETNFDTWVDVASLQPAPGYAGFLPRMRELLAQNERWLGNARIGYRSDGGLEVVAWVKNLTSEFYKANVYNFFSIGTTGYTRGDPRTFGLTMAFRY